MECQSLRTALSTECFGKTYMSHLIQVGRITVSSLDWMGMEDENEFSR